MHRVRDLAVCFILLCSVFSSSFVLAQLPECTLADYEHRYTECSSADNTRDLIYYLKPTANCSGGVPAPAPVYNLPCGTSCPAGSYLPMGTTNCSICKPGTFSIGGGYRVDSWYEWPPYFQFNRYWFWNNNQQHTPNYTMPQNFWDIQGSSLRSGNITHSQTSVLELNVYITSSTGHVSFSFRVNAEQGTVAFYDGIDFQIDGKSAMPKTSFTPNFVTVTFPLTTGIHTLRWMYIKDNSFSYFEDAAFIGMIEIGGIYFADYDCVSCPEGTYSSANGSTHCLPCPMNTYSNITGSAECAACSQHEYSYSEAASCSPRLPCDDEDYEQIYQPCVAPGTRTLEYVWLTPVTCDNSEAELPESEVVDCGPCSDGATRDSTTYQCNFCPNGTYSTGGDLCRSCPAGTVAGKIFSVTHFDDWVEGSSTDCTGDCSGQGWVLHSTYMDSGVGHGRTVNSWFQFNTTLLTTGYLYFDYNITCPSSECSFVLAISGASAHSVSGGSANAHMNITLDAGVHSLNWTFSKFGFGNNRADRAVITRIIISGASAGGAVNCTTCANGMISSAESTHCVPCGAGTTNNPDHTSCDTCPPGTHNPTPGGKCIPCGNGTYPSADGTSCVVNCTFSPDGILRYDLSPLKAGSPYGPLNDTKHQSYYFSVCAKSNLCYRDANTPIYTYACQDTTIKIPNTNMFEGHDTGNLLNWNALPNETQSLYKTSYGVQMVLTGGDNCAHSARQTVVTFVCDPSASTGALQPIGDIETKLGSCIYDFVWKSTYACPVCNTEMDMGFYYSPCQNGQRVKTWYWLEYPPKCHGGSLPDPQVVNCSESTVVCPAGQFLEGTTCQPCKAGSFSVGGGERIQSWSPFPTRFITQCTPGGVDSTTTSCTGWIGSEDELETVTSGNGNSVLSATFDFVVPGYVSFQYKLFSTDDDQVFTFSINGVPQVTPPAGVNHPGWVDQKFELDKGSYLFKWAYANGFEGNFTLGRAGVILRDVTFVGTDYHDDTCTPCPAGFHSAAGSSVCDTCGINRYSSAGSASCTPCPAGYTSLYKSSVCIPRPPCTSNDYTWVYTGCIGGSRNRTAQYLQPQFCLGTDSDLPAPQTVDCAPCPPGTFIDPAGTGDYCSMCQAGQYYTGSGCVNVPAGSMALKKKYYFVDGSAEWPTGFTAACSGDCGSTGWRIKAEDSGVRLDSGYHNINAVDSMVKLHLPVTNFASITYDFEVEANATIPLDLYINSSYIASHYGVGSHTQNLPFGTHNLTWNYHQHRGVFGTAYLSNIVVAGSTEEDAGTVSTACPPGTFKTSAGASACSPCAPGSFASEEGSATCTPCAENTYSSDFGATKCLPCRGTTYTQGTGNSFCIVDKCAFGPFNVGPNDVPVQFSFDSTDIIGPIKVGTTTFFFNFCNATGLLEAPCQLNTTHACSIEPNGAKMDWGGDLNFVAMHDEIHSGSPNTTFEISLENGDAAGCPAGSTRTMKFKFSCDVRKGAGTPEVVLPQENPCVTEFTWASANGCPVCKPTDYTNVVGDCVDGMRTSQNIRATTCNGPEVKYLPSQSCSGTVEFPIVVVFVVIGVILVLVVVAVVVFVKNRKITAQYSRLKQQSVNINDDTNL